MKRGNKERKGEGKRRRREVSRKKGDRGEGKKGEKKGKGRMREVMRDKGGEKRRMKENMK